MLRLGCLVATSILALTLGAAKADTFDVSSSQNEIQLGGTLTINTVAGTVTRQDVTSTNSPISSPAFTSLTSSVSCEGGSVWCITVNTPTSPSTVYDLEILLPVSSLIGYSGGVITTAILNTGPGTPEIAACVAAGCGELTDVGTSATPLPAALPLLATGLGAMGLLGWRRKRKNTAALAA